MRQSMMNKTRLSGIFIMILIAFSLNGAESLEKHLENLALTPMPEYEKMRNDLVKQITLEELDKLETTNVLASIMLPILKLHKVYPEIPRVFDKLWFTDTSVAMKVMKELNTVLIPGQKSKGFLSTKPPYYRPNIEVATAFFICPNIKMHVLKKYFDKYPKSRETHAHYAKITILEYLLKYEKSDRFHHFLNNFTDKRGKRIGMLMTSFCDLLDTGDILIPAAANSNARLLYNAVIMDFLLQYTDIIPSIFVMKQDKFNQKIVSLCLSRIYSAKNYTAFETLRKARKSLPRNLIKSAVHISESSINTHKWNIGEFIDFIIADFSKKHKKQIDWVEILKPVEENCLKRHPMKKKEEDPYKFKEVLGVEL